MLDLLGLFVPWYVLYPILGILIILAFVTLELLSDLVDWFWREDTKDYVYVRGEAEFVREFKKLAREHQNEKWMKFRYPVESYPSFESDVYPHGSREIRIDHILNGTFILEFLDIITKYNSDWEQMSWRYDRGEWRIYILDEKGKEIKEYDIRYSKAVIGKKGGTSN